MRKHRFEEYVESEEIESISSDKSHDAGFLTGERKREEDIDLTMNPEHSRTYLEESTVIPFREIELGVEQQKTWHIIWRVLIQSLEIIWFSFGLVIVGYYFYNFWKLDYHFVSTFVQRQNTEITYMYVEETVVKYFMYYVPYFNTTDGFLITPEYHANDVDFSSKCNNRYEFYSAEEDVNEIYDNLHSYYLKTMIVLIALTILALLIAKACIWCYAFSREIPHVFKLRIQSKWVFELTINSFINFIIVALFGMLLPVFMLDYDQSFCLMTIIDLTVKGMFEYFFAITVLYVFALIPILATILYACMEDILKYACFAFFWMTIPAFLIVIAMGIIFGIKFMANADVIDGLLIHVGNYIVLFISFLVTVIFTYKTNNRYLEEQRQQMNEEITQQFQNKRNIRLSDPT